MDTKDAFDRAAIMIEEIDKLLSAESSSLYQMVGVALADEGLGVKDDEAADDGREWWERNRQKLSRAVCRSYVVRVYLQSPRAQNRSVIVAALADLIVSVCGGIPPIVVSVLIVNEGLDSFCHSFDAGEQS